MSAFPSSSSPRLRGAPCPLLRACVACRRPSGSPLLSVVHVGRRSAKRRGRDAPADQLPSPQRISTWHHQAAAAASSPPAGTRRSSGHRRARRLQRRREGYSAYSLRSECVTCVPRAPSPPPLSDAGSEPPSSRRRPSPPAAVARDTSPERVQIDRTPSPLRRSTPRHNELVRSFVRRLLLRRLRRFQS